MIKIDPMQEKELLKRFTHIVAKNRGGFIPKITSDELLKLKAFIP